MNMMKAIVRIALTLALTIAVTTYTTTTTTTTKPDPIQQQPNQTRHERESEKALVGPTAPKKRVSRFLAEVKNPRAADHCNKDGDVCVANKTYCCNNKCIDLRSDEKNCGACKKKCKYTDVCCGGKCVNLSFDRGHCGDCNTKCIKDGFCIYGICGYA